MSAAHVNTTVAAISAQTPHSYINKCPTSYQYPKRVILELSIVELKLSTLGTTEKTTVMNLNAFRLVRNLWHAHVAY